MRAIAPIQRAANRHQLTARRNRSSTIIPCLCLIADGATIELVPSDVATPSSPQPANRLSSPVSSVCGSANILCLFTANESQSLVVGRSGSRSSASQVDGGRLVQPPLLTAAPGDGSQSIASLWSAGEGLRRDGRPNMGLTRRDDACFVDAVEPGP